MYWDLFKVVFFVKCFQTNAWSPLPQLTNCVPHNVYQQKTFISTYHYPLVNVCSMYVNLYYLSFSLFSSIMVVCLVFVSLEFSLHSDYF